MTTKKLPPLISYRHQKCWRVIASYVNRNGSVIHRISKRDTYENVTKLFDLFSTAHMSAKPKITLDMCYIVAESDGIERR